MSNIDSVAAESAKLMVSRVFISDKPSPPLVRTPKGVGKSVKDAPVKPADEKTYQPIPVKINDSDILMEGTVRSYNAADRQWTDVNLKLTADGKLTKDDQPLETKMFKIIGPSRTVNTPGTFNLNTNDESDWKPGDLFATAPELGEKWINCLTYARINRIFDNKHPHPTDEVNIENNCRMCGKKPAENTWNANGVACMFCKQGEYEACKDCMDKLKTYTDDMMITSPNHPHKLMSFADKPTFGGFGGIRAFSKWKETPCNHCGKPISGRGYYCARCEYVECISCSKPASGFDQPSPMQLQVNLLQDVLNVKSENHFELATEGKRAPAYLAMITNKPWNLSKMDSEPVPEAYFEVTFENIKESNYVSIGVGNQIFVQNKLLGYQPNSFGYFPVGKLTMNSVWSGDENLPTFGSGDTVGMGVLLDSYNEQKIYVTKNGQFVHSFSKKVHKGMDCFPGVSCGRESEAKFSVNFNGPFQFDPKLVPNYRNDRTCRIGDAPTEIISQIFNYASQSPMQVAEWRTLSKKLNDTASHNVIWKDLYMVKYPKQNAQMKIKSWFKFYQRRAEVSKKRGTRLVPSFEPPLVIENCDFEFECPLLFNNLVQKDLSKTDERYCDKCKKTVYQVHSEDQLKEYITMGRCVTLHTYINRPERGPTGPRMGSSPAPRAPIPRPFP